MKKYAVNKARLMTRAWQIAKTLTGDISARLSMGLHMAWNETKTAFFLFMFSNVDDYQMERMYQPLFSVGAYYDVKTGGIITNHWADRDTADDVKTALAEAIAERM